MSTINELLKRFAVRPTPGFPPKCYAGVIGFQVGWTDVAEVNIGEAVYTSQAAERLGLASSTPDFGIAVFDMKVEVSRIVGSEATNTDGTDGTDLRKFKHLSLDAEIGGRVETYDIGHCVGGAELFSEVSPTFDSDSAAAIVYAARTGLLPAPFAALPCPVVVDLKNEDLFLRMQAATSGSTFNLHIFLNAIIVPNDLIQALRGAVRPDLVAGGCAVPSSPMDYDIGRSPDVRLPFGSPALRPAMTRG